MIGKSFDRLSRFEEEGWTVAYALAVFTSGSDWAKIKVPSSETSANDEGRYANLVASRVDSALVPDKDDFPRAVRIWMMTMSDSLDDWLIPIWTALILTRV